MPDVPIRRKPLSRTTRFEVFKRDEFRCQYCGRHPPEVLLEVDHVVAVVEGGDDSEANLITACFDCNRGKGARSLDAVPKSLATRAAEIEEREQQLAAYRAVLQARADRIDDEAWQVIKSLFPEDIDSDGVCTTKTEYLYAAQRFTKLLPLLLLIEAAELARSAISWDRHTRFLYFCKVCWNQITQLESD